MMIDQRCFSSLQTVALLLLALCSVLPFSATAGELKRVVVIVTMPVPACETHLESFTAQLADLGYKDGENMILTIIRAKGDRQFAEDELRKVLADGRPDAVATIATLASQAAVNVLKETDVPIFFFQVIDPVGAGLIEKTGVPTGTNVTGRIFTVPAQTRMNLILRLTGQTVPENHSTAKAVRFGYIHSTYPSTMGDLRALTAIADQRNDILFEGYAITYKKVPEGTPKMLAAVETGIQSLFGKVDFWWEPQGPLGELKAYTQMLLQSSTVPIAMGQTMESVKMGALLHITPDIEASGREAATFVDAFLQGADPGKIPVVPPGKFQLGINLTTALKLGIIVPPDILDLAGKNVYR